MVIDRPLNLHVIGDAHPGDALFKSAYKHIKLRLPAGIANVANYK